jgi:hypothetical protein
MSASRDASISGTVPHQSTTGVTTCSQSGRKPSCCCRITVGWPGPSKVRTLKPRSSAAMPQRWSISSWLPSKPLNIMIVGRGRLSGAARKKIAGTVKPSAWIATRSPAGVIRETARSNCSVAETQVSVMRGSFGVPWRKKSAAR